MKNYQFITLAVLIALIGAGMFYNKKKKKCGCAHLQPETEVTLPEDEN